MKREALDRGRLPLWVGGREMTRVGCRCTLEAGDTRRGLVWARKKNPSPVYCGGRWQRQMHVGVGEWTDFLLWEEMGLYTPRPLWGLLIKCNGQCLRQNFTSDFQTISPHLPGPLHASPQFKKKKMMRDLELVILFSWQMPNLIYKHTSRTHPTESNVQAPIY